MGTITPETEADPVMEVGLMQAERVEPSFAQWLLKCSGKAIPGG